MIDLLYKTTPLTGSAASQAKRDQVTREAPDALLVKCWGLFWRQVQEPRHLVIQPSKPSLGIQWLRLVTLLVFLGASLPGQAAVIYSSATLASGAPNGISWNAYGVGFITPTNSIGFASPFRTPSFDTVADTLRIAVSLSSGDNGFVVSLFSDQAGLPEQMLAEVELRDVLKTGSNGQPSDYWVDVPLLTSVALAADSPYWIAMRSIDGSGSFLRWLQPSTDVMVENAFRNTTIPGSSWSKLGPLEPAAFEIVGDTLPVPEPGTLSLLLSASVCFFGISRNATIRYHRSKSRPRWFSGSTL